MQDRRARRLGSHATRSRPLRVLHGPANIGNQPWVLSRYERELGAHSDLVVNYGTWLRYPADRILSEYARRTPRAAASRMSFTATAPFRYDAFHYYFARTHSCWDDFGGPNAAWYSDMRMARQLGKTIVMTLQGCDVRDSARSAEMHQYSPCHEGNCGAAATCRSQVDRQRSELQGKWRHLVDRAFVLNPDLARFVPSADFLPYCSVDIASFDDIAPKAEGPVRIVHAPSDEGIKGSRYIIAAVERLQEQYPIEFEFVKGLPYEEALSRYVSADLVIDQLFAGWYGGLAVEAMAMGKPVACYLRDGDFGVLPPGMRRQLPLIRITADTIVDDLAKVLDHRSELPDIGAESRRFVRRWHDPARIASAMLRVYEDPSAPLDLDVD